MNYGELVRKLRALYVQNGTNYVQHAADVIENLQKEIETLRRGEFICQRCGIRKDSEHEPGDF